MGLTAVSLTVPVTSLSVNYEINEIPVATIEVPFGMKPAPGVPLIASAATMIPWNQLARVLTQFRPCVVSVTAFSSEISSQAVVFAGYTVACSISMHGGGGVVKITAVGLLADLGFGSTMNHLIHGNSPTDFSVSPYVLGAATIHQLSSGQFPDNPALTIFPGAAILVNLKQLILASLGIQLSNPITSVLAQTRLMRATGLPVPAPLGNMRALMRVGSLQGQVVSNLTFANLLPAFIFSFAEALASTLVFAKLLECGQIFNFIIAPTTSGGFMLPDNPLYPVPSYIINTKDVLEIAADIGSRADIRGIVLVGQAQKPFDLDMLSNQATVLGYYDSGWFPFAAGLNLPGALLAIPAPPWLKGINFTDYLISLYQDMIAPAVFGAPLNEQTTIYMKFYDAYFAYLASMRLLRAGILYAGSVYHKLAFSSRIMKVRLPLFRAMRGGFIVGPGTIVRVLGPNWFNQNWTNQMDFIGRVHSTEIVYDIEKKRADVILTLTHVRYMQEIVAWYFTNFLFNYGSHPMWQDFPGVNMIGVS
jgi:hypothetical protein